MYMWFLSSYQKHEWKLRRTRNAVETDGREECFHSFFEFVQIFTSVSIIHRNADKKVFSDFF